tara:strand:- start:22156 stop:23316 length:1161 start_codon:yes stop_codon:yes gene_type:complete
MAGLNASTIKLLHYNIKELDSAKIQSKHEQLFFVQKVTQQKDFNLFSINELQYDLINIPNESFKSKGENLKKLLSFLELKHLSHTSFHPANTGENAKTKADGTYYTHSDSPQAREHADQLNFGVMPGQYSSGGASQFPIVKEVIIKDLLWRDFNPAINFDSYATPDGASIPKDMKLFDKNFSDITLDVDGKKLHFILLHTVPSYHFGNKKSINDKRNADQLRFLEWYLTGNTDFEVKLQDYQPLNTTDRFIAVGDFNVAFNDKDSEGSSIMKRILNKTKPWIPLKEMNYTNESSHFAPRPMRLMLDYIVTSKNIKHLKGEIMLPKMKRIELGCKQAAKSKIKEQVKEYKKVSYQKDNQNCQVLIPEMYYNYKMASDHYPLYGEFEL